MSHLKLQIWCLVSTSVVMWSIGCARRTRTVIVERRPGPDRVVVAEPARPGREVREVIVVEPPPAERVEVAPLPRPGYYWVPGHYIHNGRSYAWVSGRLERLPRSDAVWETGRWDRRGDGYVWIEGRWR